MPVCPGMISVKLVATPIKGLFISECGIPVAYNNALCGTLSNPFLIRSLFMVNYNEEQAITGYIAA
jgi:hypothetical protein